jgi:uncharacterized membrane protein
MPPSLKQPGEPKGVANGPPVTRWTLAILLLVLVLFNFPLPPAGQEFVEARQGLPLWRWPALALRYYGDWGGGDVGHYYNYAQMMVGQEPDRADLLEGWADLGSLAASMQPPGRVEGPLLPYRDFQVEYPPLMPILMWLPRLMGHDLASYTLAFKAEMGLLWLAALWLALRQLSPQQRGRAEPLALAAVLATGHILLQRLDAALAYLLVVAVVAGQQKRARLSGVALGLGAAAKLFPLLLAPFWWKALPGQRKAFTLALAGTLAVCFGIPWMLAGSRFWILFAYHAGRPIQLESLYSSLALCSGLQPVKVISSFGSFNLELPAPGIWQFASGLVPLTLLGLAWWRCQGLAQGALCGTLILASTTRVLSPQYMIWLFPLALLVDRPRLQWALVLACLLTQILFPPLYPALRALESPAIYLLTVRNWVLLAALVSLLEIRRRS